ncbi:MAG: 2,3-bisphosphoglycerate-independent phosphoglycerate mutase [Desulfohalobiaceae bacterium]|nr:2,3-bisphosphoglycerate-independent phosphoglycerate mutase [Desulfohalobiaceae bacterium]
MTRKLLFLIADGMGDYPLPELEGRTPMEAAETPNMDRLASLGTLGLCRTIPRGMGAGSDIANMSLLGFDPAIYHTGRGPIEAAAQGLPCENTDLIYRLNLCTVSEFSAQGVMLDHSGGHISEEDGAFLIQRLQRELLTDDFVITPGFQYRHLLIQKGGVLGTENDLNISPPHDLINKHLDRDLALFNRSRPLSNLVYQGARLLRDTGNPTRVNAVWPWGQGRPLSLPDYNSHFGYRGAVVSAVDLIKGLGRAAGMTVPDIPGATGLLDTDYRAKCETARELLEKNDFLYLHLEAPDECGHSGNIKDKIEAIRRFDHLILGPLLKSVEEYRAGCLIGCDHLTPIVKQTHTHDPVPFLFYDPLSPSRSPVSGFSEQNAGEASLIIDPGHNLLPCLVRKMKAVS